MEEMYEFCGGKRLLLEERKASKSENLCGGKITKLIPKNLRSKLMKKANSGERIKPDKNEKM